jgi:hypothetical protein
MPRPVHFEIHAQDPPRAIRFYETVFGWRLDRWGEQEYWVITTGPDGEPGINGGLLPRMGPPPAPGAAVNAFPMTVDVPDLDETLKEVEGSGGTLALPKQPVPGVGWLAYVKDTEGNLLGIMQADESAA